MSDKPKPLHSSDKITLLKARDGKILAKRFTRQDGELTKRSYDRAYEFQVWQIDLSGVDDLGRLINDVADQAAVCVIRGEPRPGINRDRARRRLHDGTDPDTGEILVEATFDPAARRWGALDLDGLEPSHGLVADTEVAFRIVQRALPAEFQGVTCVWQHTASAGIKPGVHARLWYWFDRPVADHELKCWLSGVPVDRSLFNPVQVHYTATPLFSDPADDPIAERIVLLRGDTDVIAVPEITLPEANPDADRVTTEIRAKRTDYIPDSELTETRLYNYVRTVLDNVRGAPTGQRHERLRNAAIKLGSLCVAGLGDWEATERALWDAGCAALDEATRRERIRDGSLRRTIAWGFERAQDKPNLPEGF
jgi:hypothetical protein